MFLVARIDVGIAGRVDVPAEQDHAELAPGTVLE